MTRYSYRSVHYYCNMAMLRSECTSNPQKGSFLERYCAVYLQGLFVTVLISALLPQLLLV